MCKGYDKLDIEKSADPAGDAAKAAKAKKRKSKAAKVARKIGKAIVGDVVKAMRTYKEDSPFYGMAIVYA